MKNLIKVNDLNQKQNFVTKLTKKCRNLYDKMSLLIIRWYNTHIDWRYHQTKYYFKNCWRFRKFLRTHVPWDYSGFFYFMEDFTTDLMSTEKYAITKGYSKEVVNMKVVRELAKRLAKDEYALNKFDFSMEFKKVEGKNYGTIDIGVKPFHDFPTTTKHFYDQKIENQDLDLMFKILRNHIRCWWD